MSDARGGGSPGCLTAADESLDLGGRLSGDARIRLPRRINTDEAKVEKDIAKLVLALVDLVRQLMERQAVRRVNGGSLTEDEVERMGETFLKLDQRMTQLRLAFGLEREDLDLNLGPIRDLLQE